MSYHDLLPGRFVITAGSAGDYARLERFHYLARRPATWAGIWAMHYHDRHPPGPPAGRLVAVGVLSYPAATLHQRERLFAMATAPPAERIRFANANIRVISRVIVHPQFRGLGVATQLVRHLCRHCPTRYVEALARMGHVHPLFERAGMTRHDPPAADRPVYYLFDRCRS